MRHECEDALVKWWAFFIVYGLTGIAVSLALFRWLLDLPLGVALVANFVFFVVWVRLANRVGAAFGVVAYPPMDPESLESVHEGLRRRRRY